MHIFENQKDVICRCSQTFQNMNSLYLYINVRNK